MRVRLTMQASADLRQIWNYVYISGAGPETADEVLRRLDRRIRQLIDFPYRGVARSDLGDDVRLYVIQRWVVLYQVMPSELLVGRIVDGARDLSNLVTPSDEDL